MKNKEINKREREKYQESSNGAKANSEETTQIRISEKGTKKRHEIDSSRPKKQDIVSFSKPQIVILH